MIEDLRYVRRDGQLMLQSKVGRVWKDIPIALCLHRGLLEMKSNRCCDCGLVLSFEQRKKRKAYRAKNDDSGISARGV